MQRVFSPGREWLAMAAQLDSALTNNLQTEVIDANHQHYC